MDPLWAELEALLGSRPVFSPTHPWGCHRRRIPDRVVFEPIVEAMVHGAGYEIIASRGCSDRTIRRRVVGRGEPARPSTAGTHDRSHETPSGHAAGKPGDAPRLRLRRQ